MSRWCLAALLLFVLPESVNAALVTHWNFNTYDGDATTINADSGTGAITLTQVGGLPWPADQLDAVDGTTMNAVGTDEAGSALDLGHPDSDVLLTRNLTFEIDTTGWHDLMFSAAVAGSNATFNNADVLFSLTGNELDFTDTGIDIDPSTSGNFQTHIADLSSFDAIENESSVFIRLSLSGENLQAGQSLSIDNVQFLATPEAPAWAMMLVAAALMAVLSWWRQSDKHVKDLMTPGTTH